MPTRGVLVPGLRGVRLRRLLTQEELAKRAGVGRNTIARVEDGEVPAAVATVRKLAQALDANIAELMGSSEEGKSGPAAPSKHTPAPLPTPWVQHGVGAAL